MPGLPAALGPGAGGVPGPDAARNALLASIRNPNIKLRPVSKGDAAPPDGGGASKAGPRGDKKKKKEKKVEGEIAISLSLPPTTMMRYMDVVSMAC